MKSAEEIFNILKSVYPEDILEFNNNKLFEYCISVKAQAIKKISSYLFLHKELLFDNLILLSAVDDANGEKINSPDGSFDYKGGTLTVFYHLESTKLKHKVCLKVTVERENPIIPSVVEIWRHADFEEREAYDMLGVIFEGHPNLKRILMPYDWEFGHPLRKDYRNPEFYQGMRVPY